MITFITEYSEESSRFSDVDEDQFFIDIEGNLCQRCSVTKYNVIADKNGDPLAIHHDNVNEDEIIRKILPEVTKIQFS